MAMNVSQLTDEIIAELESRGFEPVAQKTANRPFFEAIADAVITHIQDNATANVSSGSSSGNWPIS